MKKPSEQYSEQETVARREATLERMLATPHKPHKAATAKQGSKRKGGPLKKEI
jgi:hypothetical protein